MSSMTPESSPGMPSGNSGVRRVNNNPIYITVAIMAVFLVLMAVVAMDRADRQQVVNEDKDTEKETTNLLASLITGDFTGDGIIEAQKLQSDISPGHDISGQNILIARPDNPDLLPLPYDPAMHHDLEFDPEIEHFRQLKRQLFEEAVRSGITVTRTEPERANPVPGNTSSSGSMSRDDMLARLAALRKETGSQESDATHTYLSKLQQIREDNYFAGDDSAPYLLDEDTGRQGSGYSDFDGDKARWTLDSQPEKPMPYSLLTGFVIPAILKSGIQSDLPGQIMAQVSQNVFDTPVGNHLLIPQGAQLVGTYSSEVEFGQARVLVAWQRIVFPDGKTMDIGAMPGADTIGQSGFNDRVNNHYLRIFGSALLMSAVIAGAAYSQRDAGSAFGRQNAGSILSQSLGQQLGMVTARLINKNLNIAPSLQIRPGFRFNVVVTKDMVFSRPYRSFD